MSMIELKRFLVERIREIQFEIDELPEGGGYERNADSLGIDLAYYETGLEILDEYEGEQSWTRLQQSRAFTARLDRSGMGRAHESEAKRL